MNTLIEMINSQGFTDRVLTDVDLANLTNSTPASRYALVNKAFKKNELIQVRRGLYVLDSKFRRSKLSKLFLASRICPHSYISLQSALSYHGWIPELVTTTTSIIAQGRTKKFSTPFGEFNFYLTPSNEYEFYTGVTRIAEIAEQPFLIASPLRALADLVYLQKLDWQGINFLTDSLRIEIDVLLELTLSDFLKIKRVYHSQRVQFFLQQLENEITNAK